MNGKIACLLSAFTIAVAQAEAAQWTYRELHSRFLELGLCNACEDNVAQHVLHRPNDRCSMLAKQALKGDTNAIDTLADRFPWAYCTWDYEQSGPLQTE
jgi:hypothetical protein